jgi:transcriptional regulator with XRE-family HTH domain
MEYRMALALARGRAHERRERIGASQVQEADAIGVSPTHLGHLENGGAVAEKVIVASSARLAAIETGLGLYEPDGVHIDVAQLGARVAELELRLEALEADRAEEAGRIATAAAVLGNGHADRPVPLTAA